MLVANIEPLTSFGDKYHEVFFSFFERTHTMEIRLFVYNNSINIIQI